MIILYPTETVYGLGVNPLDPHALESLYILKGRDEGKPVSWLVRTVSDIEMYAMLGARGMNIAQRFLPGPLTLCLPLHPHIREKYPHLPPIVGFRISSDSCARSVIETYMTQHHTPLTCTSANVSGEETLPTVPQICAQFGTHASRIDTIYNDGPRTGVPSTVVSVIDETLICIREGAIPFGEIEDACYST